jgi:hypothetical protein
LWPVCRPPHFKKKHSQISFVPPSSFLVIIVSIGTFVNSSSSVSQLKQHLLRQYEVASTITLIIHGDGHHIIIIMLLRLGSIIQAIIVTKNK